MTSYPTDYPRDYDSPLAQWVFDQIVSLIPTDDARPTDDQVSATVRTITDALAPYERDTFAVPAGMVDRYVRVIVDLHRMEAFGADLRPPSESGPLGREGDCQPLVSALALDLVTEH